MLLELVLLMLLYNGTSREPSSSSLSSVAYLGWVDIERCPPPSRRRLIFSTYSPNNLYRENNGLVALFIDEFKGKLDNISKISITATETLNSINIFNI